MKLNIFSAVLFILGAIGLLITKQYYLEDFYFSQMDGAFIEKIKINDDIEHLRTITLGLLVIDENNVKSYNELMVNAVELLILLCFLSAFISILAIVSIKNFNKSLKDGMPEPGASKRKH